MNIPYLNYKATAEEEPERRSGNSRRRRATYDVEEGRRRPWGQEVAYNTLALIVIDWTILFTFVLKEATPPLCRDLHELGQ